MDRLKQLFAGILGEYITELSQEEIFDLIEIPPQGLGADFAFPSFSLAKSRKKSPQHIAQDITNSIKSQENYQLSAVGPYINIIFSLESIIQYSQEFSNSLHPTHQALILIESPSPNTNKPLHLGHVRNMVLGNVLDRTLRHQGFTTKKVEVINDRGIHICKSMLAYQLRGEAKEPDKKGDHFVGDWYVRFAQELEKDPSLLDQAQAMLREREAGNPEVIALWKKMNGRALEGMRQTYKRYETRIDDATLESEVYLDGKSIVKNGREQGIFIKDPKGNTALPILNQDGEVSYFVVLRSDDTTVYSTQDLALVDQRFQKYNMDQMIYVVGEEQNDYFKALFKCFTALHYPFADQCYHLSYGMIELPSGKMKSRTGNVVDADELIENLHHISFTEIKKRYADLADSEAHERAEKIALGAINFFMIKIDAKKGFVFDPAASLNFEGETGPYIQYSYARITSLIKKVTSLNPQQSSLPPSQDIIVDSQQDTEELALIKNIFLHKINFESIIHTINKEHKPHLLARYTLDLCQMINSFYQKYRIVNPDQQLMSARYGVLCAAQETLKEAMQLLGIAIIEEM